MVTLSTRIYISCARKLHFEDLSEAENRNLWGADWSPQGLGGNLAVEATIGGEDLFRYSGIPVNSYSGIPEYNPGHLMNPPDFEWLLKEVCRPLDHADLGLQSLEQIGIWVYKHLTEKLPASLKVQNIRVKDGSDQWVDVLAPEKVQLTRVYQIQCVHRHHNPDLSIEENAQLYHKCSAMHGHSYKIEVVVEKPLERGLVFARGELDKIVNEKLVIPFNGTLLNDHLGNTSGEIIAQKFFALLAPHLNGLTTIIIRETRKNSFFIQKVPVDFL